MKAGASAVICRGAVDGYLTFGESHNPGEQAAAEAD
jgi:hypothetical protein